MVRPGATCGTDAPKPVAGPVARSLAQREDESHARRDLARPTEAIIREL